MYWLQKVLGKDIHEFLQEDWELVFEKATYHEDSGRIAAYNEQGEFALENDKEYSLRSFGDVIDDSEYDSTVLCSFESGYKRYLKWKENQEYEVISVKVPRAEKKEFLWVMEEKSWTVL